MALRKRDIDALSYNAKAKTRSGKPRVTQITWDTDERGGKAEALAGFGVQVFPTGRKSYVVQYRVAGKERRMSLGPTSKRSVDQAREEARKLLVQALSGIDPAAERQRKPVSTFKTFAEEYVDKHAKPHKRSWGEDQRRIKKHLLPRWGRRALDSISRADVAKLHADVGAETRHEANQLLALVGVMYVKARDWGNVPENFANPAHSIKPFPVQSRKRWLRPEELKRLWDAIEDGQNVFYRCAFKLYTLIGVRRSELLRLRWDDVDFTRREVLLRDTKAKRDHQIPLPPLAVELFAELRENRVKDNPFVFPSPTIEGGHMHDLKGPWRSLRKCAKLEDVRLHDLRRTVGSMLAQSGQTQLLIAKILNHSDIKTTAVYTQLADENARAALEQHEDNMISLTNYRKRKEA